MKSRTSLKTLSDKYPVATRLKGLHVSSLKIASGGLTTGSDILDLASGSPMFDPPEHLLEEASAAISGGHNRYGNTFGDEILRANIALSRSTEGGRILDGDTEVTVTNGTSSALAASLMATINHDDEVIVFEPFYESYIQAIKLAGGIPRIVALKPGKWNIALDQLESAFNKKTRAVILNTPHNPTGQIFTSENLNYLLDLCEEYGAVVISDEIYSRLTMGKNEHLSPLSLEDDPNRVIVIDGLSKAYNISGWRIGYILASSQYTSAIRLVHSTLGLAAPTPLQIAARDAFTMPGFDDGDARQPGSLAYYKRNLNQLFAAIKKAGLTAVKPKGANFIFVDASTLKTKEKKPVEVLLEKTGILTISGSSFFQKGGSRYLRFCFARSHETIEEACRRLEKLS